MRLNHVTVIVSDLERSMAFYRTLGLVPIVHAPPRYARFVCPAESSLAAQMRARAERTTPAITDPWHDQA